MEDIRVVAEQMRAAAEMVRQLAEGKAREHKARLQHIEQLLHLTISEFQEALVKQWQVTNDVTTAAHKILHTAEPLLHATQERARQLQPSGQVGFTPHGYRGSTSRLNGVKRRALCGCEASD